MSTSTEPARRPTHLPSPSMSPAAELIMQTQQEILDTLRSLLPPPDAAGTPSENPAAAALVATMVELLNRILTAVNLQRDLMEAILGLIRGGPGTEAALNEALRRRNG